MKAAALVVALASACGSLVAAATEELKIDVTLPVDCDRKTKEGDKVSMHYKGTLQKTGEKFDASEQCLVSLLADELLNANDSPPSGYDRGQPFSFTLGSKHVIKGFVVPLSGSSTAMVLAHWLTMAPDGSRASWTCALARSGEFRCAHGPILSSTGRECVWLADLQLVEP